MQWEIFRFALLVGESLSALRYRTVSYPAMSTVTKRGTTKDEELRRDQEPLVPHGGRSLGDDNEDEREQKRSKSEKPHSFRVVGHLVMAMRRFQGGLWLEVGSGCLWPHVGVPLARSSMESTSWDVGGRMGRLGQG